MGYSQLVGYVNRQTAAGEFAYMNEYQTLAFLYILEHLIFQRIVFLV